MITHGGGHVTTRPGKPQVMTEEQFALFAARFETRVIFISLVFLGTGIVQGLRGAWPPPAKILVFGALAAIVGTLFFARALSRNDVSSRTAFYAIGGFFPQIFSIYLCFYRGFWEGRHLLESFSIAGLLGVTAFIYLGYRLAWWTWQLTEVADALRTGKIVVSRAAAKSPAAAA